MAAYLSEKSDLSSRQLAARLEPGNAEYRYRIGRYFALALQSPEAVENYRAALALNSHHSDYWLGLATAYKVLGDQTAQQAALEHAISVDPTTPDVAWQAANLYLSNGNTTRAIQEFRVVLQNDSYRMPSALELCWRAEPDVELLLRNVIPPTISVYSSFLELLISKKELAAAATVWGRSVELQQPVETRYVFEYVKVLVDQGDVAQARKVWQQAAHLSDLTSYQSSPENLVINGEFSLPLLNAGFDWQYEKRPTISLSLDPMQSHLGPHSLRISFEGGPVDSAGIRQLIPAEPNTNYDFSAYFKAESVEGAGGPQFAINDFYSGSTYFTSEELKNSDVWKQVSGSFTTRPDAKLLTITIRKIPPDTAVRGKLWIDGVRLAQTAHIGHGL